MPLRRYRPVKPPCRLCGEGFDHFASGEATLSACPKCGQAILPEAVQGAAPQPRVVRKPGLSEIKNSGFTVLKRTPGGEYEKQ